MTLFSFENILGGLDACFELLPYLLHLLLFGRETFELFSGIVYPPTMIGLSCPLIRSNLFLPFAREGIPIIIIVFGPRPRALNGR